MKKNSFYNAFGYPLKRSTSQSRSQQTIDSNSFTPTAPAMLQPNMSKKSSVELKGGPGYAALWHTGSAAQRPVKPRHQSYFGFRFPKMY